jgi:S-adenosylmethionine-diacylgycerolhomoserine-N-methlytransferase
MVNASDARVLWALLRGQSRRGSHAERLQAFYAPQASRYDYFRERLLHGRRELIADLAPTPGARVVELGAGTGRNLDFFGDRLATFGHVDLVDLCPALLAQARTRTAAMRNVAVVEADVTDWRPDEPVDVVYFSYALTMIPDWRGAIDNAIAMLRPGGRLGVVDFYVSMAAGGPGRVRHGLPTRVFWPRWFGHDGVHLDPAHLAYLMARLPDHSLHEKRAPVPYLPGLRVPHYRFVGRKPA